MSVVYLSQQLHSNTHTLSVPHKITDNKTIAGLILMFKRAIVKEVLGEERNCHKNQFVNKVLINLCTSFISKDLYNW